MAAWPRRWDDASTHYQLATLTARRARFRLVRAIDRMRSPRRIIATSLAILFFALYLLNGIFILSARAPADPERLRLWLSGGMLIYAVYHCVRCSWSTMVSDLELTSAEKLWLAGAPVRRSSLAVYHLGNIIVAALLKTFLLAVVLAGDVGHLELLIVGVFTSLLLLESARLIIQRFFAGLHPTRLSFLRIATSLVGAALIVQVIARMAATTPIGSPTWMYVLSMFDSLGQTAASDTVQWLSLPWIVPAQIAVTEHYAWLTPLQLAGSAALIPLSIALLVRVDAWAAAQRLLAEQETLRNHRYHRSDTKPDAAQEIGVAHPLRAWLQPRLPRWCDDTLAVLSRQAISIHRYRRTIALSFVIPLLLCLSPLFTGQVSQQWFFVVGGIAMCTMLLAPPALRLDFRRDLRRMLLLRSMPVTPLSMVMGQLTLPILITCLFQWITIAVAASVVQPGTSQVIMWTGMLTALAVFTFASENALFLAFPHHQHSQGLAMMVRAKLTFMGKATVIAIAIGMLGGWAIACGRLPGSLAGPCLVSGALLASWIAAALAIAACTLCWRRFDLSLDVPPE
jgi:hypothetical protein